MHRRCSGLIVTFGEQNQCSEFVQNGLIGIFIDSLIHDLKSHIELIKFESGDGSIQRGLKRKRLFTGRRS